MIILDTNILSEMMRQSPSGNVIFWLNEQNSDDLFITTISIAEIEYGLNTMADGKRRHELAQKFDYFINHAFSLRILDFDRAAAHYYGEIMGERKMIGRPMSVPDGQICALAKRHGYGVATRNVSDFEGCGVDIINPFECEIK